MPNISELIAERNALEDLVVKLLKGDFVPFRLRKTCYWVDKDDNIFIPKCDPDSGVVLSSRLKLGQHNGFCYNCGGRIEVISNE